MLAPQTEFHGASASLPPSAIGSFRYDGDPGNDAVTGLPARARLEWYLEHLLMLHRDQDAVSALLVIEFNELRAMRYAFGEDLCNRFVQIISDRVRSETTSGNFIASVSADELAFVVTRDAGREHCRGLARQLQARISEGVCIGGREYFSSASIGIAYTEPGASCTDWLHLAQAAVHEARIESADGVRFACSDSIRQASEELVMQNEGRLACERGEFYLAYQPVVDMETGVIRSVEALLRWQSPRFGEVSPARFVPLLEQCGAIRETGDWVLRTACRQARIWNQSAPTPIRVAVNVSAAQLELPAFDTHLITILAETRCRPVWLEIEITESVVMRTVESVRQCLLALAERGVTFAIDDFGTGYSSLSQLALLPVHHLKIDRSLVANLPGDRKGAAIVRAMQSLTEALGLKLTVEGIERDDQRLFFRQAQACNGQGYLFSRPMPADEMTRMLQTLPAEWVQAA